MGGLQNAGDAYAGDRRVTRDLSERESMMRDGKVTEHGAGSEYGAPQTEAGDAAPVWPLP